MKDDEFVFAKQNESDTLQNNNQENKEDLNQENANTANNRNVNTYFENRLPRNVNTYFLPPHMPYGYSMGGYGMGGFRAYGGMGGMGGYGGAMPYGMNGYGGIGGTPYGMGGTDLQNQANNQAVYNSTNRRQPNINTYGLGISNINTYKKAETKENIFLIKEDNAENNAQVNLNKLSAIYSSASHLVNINADVFDIKERISYVISTLKETIKSLEKSDKELTQQQVKSIEILIENINSYITKIDLSKNQLKYEINKIKNLKDDFLSNNNELSARYIMLANFLDTRYSYYSNISNCLQEILYKISYQIDASFQMENSSQNLYEIEQTEEDNQENNPKNITIQDSDIFIENIEIAEQKTLQEQLEESWKQNFINQNLLNEESQIELKENEELQTELKENEEMQTIEEKNIDGFKANPTKKQEVSSENIILTNAVFSPNNYLPSVTEAEEIEKLFPSNFPFKKPQKNDYLKICCF